MESITREIGQRIRYYRRQRGLTQETLAEKAELHHTYIGQVERGEKNITLVSLEKITGALDITFANLFEHIEDAKAVESIPAKCYQLVSSKSEPQQSCLYHILQDVEALMEEQNL